MTLDPNGNQQPPAPVNIQITISWNGSQIGIGGHIADKFFTLGLIEMAKAALLKDTVRPAAGKIPLGVVTVPGVNA